MPALVQDGVDRDGRFARLSIAENQFALAAPDRNERIDDLQSRLQRHDYGRAVHDGRCRALDRQSLVGGNRPFAIERLAQWVDHPSQQTISHRYVHDPPGAFDFVAGVQILIFAEQDDADFVLIHVECDAEQSPRKPHQLFISHAGKAGKRGDSGGDIGDDTDFTRRKLRRESFPHLPYPANTLSKSC